MSCLCQSDVPSPRCGTGRASHAAAFTLIELLVVIAILSLLVSILVPSLKRAKELARAAVCQVNLHNAYCGIALYADENDGWFGSDAWVRLSDNSMGALAWHDWLRGDGTPLADDGYDAGSNTYLGGGSTVCPSLSPTKFEMSTRTQCYGINTDGGRLNRWSGSSGDGVTSQSYAWPYGGDMWFYNLHNAPDPSEAKQHASNIKSEILLADTIRCPTSFAYGQVQYRKFAMKLSNPFHTSTGGIHARHSDKAHLLHWDGHLTIAGPEELQDAGLETFWVGDDWTLYDPSFGYWP